MKNYYQKEIETASREEILKIQNEKIVRQVKHVYDNVPYWKVTFDDVPVGSGEGMYSFYVDIFSGKLVE